VLPCLHTRAAIDMLSISHRQLFPRSTFSHRSFLLRTYRSASERLSIDPSCVWRPILALEACASISSILYCVICFCKMTHSENSLTQTGAQQERITITFLALAWLFILLRIWTRTYVISNFGKYSRRPKCP
jgi:hypothetical protein